LYYTTNMNNDIKGTMHGAPEMLSQFLRFRVILSANLAAAILDGTVNSASNAR